MCQLLVPAVGVNRLGLFEGGDARVTRGVRSTGHTDRHLTTSYFRETRHERSQTCQGRLNCGVFVAASMGRLILPRAVPLLPVNGNSSIGDNWGEERQDSTRGKQKCVHACQWSIKTDLAWFL